MSEIILEFQLQKQTFLFSLRMYILFAKFARAVLMQILNVCKPGLSDTPGKLHLDVCERERKLDFTSSFKANRERKKMSFETKRFLKRENEILTPFRTSALKITFNARLFCPLEIDEERPFEED